PASGKPSHQPAGTPGDDFDRGNCDYAERATTFGVNRDVPRPVRIAGIQVEVALVGRSSAQVSEAKDSVEHLRIERHAYGPTSALMVAPCPQPWLDGLWSARVDGGESRRHE